MANALYVSTRKGLMIYRKVGGVWAHDSTHFLGSNASLALPSPDGKTVVAALNLGHFGVKMHRSLDAGKTWTEFAPPTYPTIEGGEKDDKAPSLKGVWALEWADPKNPKALWCGTAPGGLFYSPDLGDTWVMNTDLWSIPEREKWMGGGTEHPALHSICVDPRNTNRVAIAVSCGGVRVTNDGGKTWEVGAKGMRAAFMPPEMQFDPDVQDPHMMVQSPTSPDIYWTQHHNGIFRSTDNLQSWHEITTAPISSFGFAVAVHPKNADVAWFVPAKKDEDRFPVDGNVVVNRTKDGGKSFETLKKGLPQGNAFDLIYRHGLAVDDTGNELAMGSTTGSLWSTGDGGDSWQLISAHLPPI
ncbi:MAG: hypothetical protein JNM81_03410, partial [Rhodospirillaceae bacterium]|nr:hypothetical protein [Rhodospirillaceae bacterium]